MVTELENIQACIDKLRSYQSILDKQTIGETHKSIGNSVLSSSYFKDTAQQKTTIKIGDDTAAIPQADGSHLLFAAEGIIDSFLTADPWFAGYSAVMVNISDICAMGGLPIAVTDTIYAKNSEDSTHIWEGMIAASEKYGVPIVGGHTCYHSKNKALSVSILGKATENLLTSFDAKPNEKLILAIDQNGAYYKAYPFWNASTTADANRLQELVQLPYKIANKKLSQVCKDVSMGGIIGTICMLMNTSDVGVEIDLEKITKPKDVLWEKWLVSFPSYGYLFSCREEHIAEIQTIFSEKGINCDEIGTITTPKELIINYKEQKIKF
ncbi:sll0787 family AIR synthase-like protein [Aquimarina agarivorans]|uniref:sll0787 family AIR synthase-like protein n=1 Tax=Aquimarina agarivorans TaxID=980584 RepID=UPI000248F2E3|nr:sll0787 family AIR synthase-like protein [Aquimarina agarivorans]